MEKTMKGDMTQGNTARILITFAIPMVLGNIFQQLYNTTDAIIVGRFVGKNALAAVGVANPIMSIAIFFIVGICIGTSVIMSRLFGAGKLDMLKKEISTALIIGTVFTIILSVVCIFLSRFVLIATGTPDEILNDADTFLKIVFSGLIFSFLYNFYSAALRSIGDSVTPLIFLIVSSVLNGILAVIFVVVFGLGVAGSAIATVISQAVSSALCIAYVYIKIPLISLKPSEMVVDKPLLKETIQYSWVTALQQTWLYIGKLLVQGVVNPFGTSAIAAYNSATRVDSFVLAPGDSFSASASTYTAQNKGAGKWERIIEGYKKSTLIITVYSVIASIIIFLGAEGIMKLFIDSFETEVIEIGVRYLKLMSLFYILSGFNNIFQGFFRGVGKLRITLIATALQITARVGLSYALAPHFGIAGVVYAIAIGWVLMASYEGLSLRSYFKEIKYNAG
jgi:putative MATE family efflux protein